MNPYEQLLASEWQNYPEGVRLAHSVPLSASGQFVVRRGKGRAANWLADRFRLPHPGENVQVRLSVTEDSNRIRWRRTFDGKDYPPTLQWKEGGLLIEKAGPAQYIFILRHRGNSVHYQQVAFRLFGLLMPPSLSMHVWAKVDPAECGWRVKVAIRAPFVGLICRYAGNMRPE